MHPVATSPARAMRRHTPAAALRAHTPTRRSARYGSVCTPWEHHHSYSQPVVGCTAHPEPGPSLLQGCSPLGSRALVSKNILKLETRASWNLLGWYSSPSSLRISSRYLSSSSSDCARSHGALAVNAPPPTLPLLVSLAYADERCAAAHLVHNGPEQALLHSVEAFLHFVKQIDLGSSIAPWGFKMCVCGCVKGPPLPKRCSLLSVSQHRR